MKNFRLSSIQFSSILLNTPSGAKREGLMCVDGDDFILWSGSGL